MLNQHKKQSYFRSRKIKNHQRKYNTIRDFRNLRGSQFSLQNKSNNEVWSYNKMSVVNKQGGTDFLFGARASQSSSTQSFDLIITFDSNDIVSDYSVISTSY